MNEAKPIRYEDNAEQRTVTGWCCKTCNRWWDKDEHMARYCCSTERQCECGNGIARRGWIKCDACNNADRLARWLAKPEIEWDGEFPLGLWDDDQYFWNADELLEYVFEQIEDNDEVATLDSRWESLQLTTCYETKAPHFEMNEFLCDVLGEDQELDTKAIDATV